MTTNNCNGQKQGHLCGVLADHLAVTAFYGINNLPVGSRPFLTLACSLDSRTKEYFHLNSGLLFDLGHGLKIELQYKLFRLLNNRGN